MAELAVVERKEVPGLATLYLADLGGGDKRLVEFVDTLEPGVPKDRKWVLMISTQVGCAVGCRMCDAGAMGFHGNLSADEMLAQVRRVFAENPGLDPARHPKLKIHFARMGEPALNPAVLEALDRLARDYPHPGVMPSFSTVAPKTPVVTDFMERLRRVKDAHYGNGRFQLQFSLHATGEDRRREIVPVRKWSLGEVAEYGERFVGPGDRKVTLNFALSRGERLDAERLSAVFDPARFLIKVTPVNPTARADASRASFVWNEAPGDIAEQAAELRRRGFVVILSPSMPEEIEAETSCGQLWSAILKGRAERELRALESEAASYATPETLPGKAALWIRALGAEPQREFPFRIESSALLVVDMQDFFLSRESPAYMPQARAVLGGVRRLVDAYRRAGRPVLFTVHAHEDPLRDGGLMTRWWRKVCLASGPWARVASVLEASEGEIFRKCRYSALTNPGVEAALRRRGVDSLVVAGVLTNLCVESTVRAAFDLGIPCVVAADATAAHTEELHLASLRSMAHGFARVRMAAELLKELEVPRPA